jgi:hypothetical protein
VLSAYGGAPGIGLSRTNDGGFSYVFSDTFYSKEGVLNDTAFSVMLF